MAEPPQQPEPAPKLFPGAAELFAICYRTQWRHLRLTPPDKLVNDVLRLRPPQSLEQAVAGIVAWMDKLRTPADLPPGFSNLREPRLYPFNLARMAMAQLARGDVLESAPSDQLQSLNGQLALALEHDPEFQQLQNEYQNVYEITGQRESEDSDLLPRFQTEQFTALVNDAARDPDARFFRSFSAPELRLLNGQSSAPRRIRNYTTTRSYINRVSDARASIEVNLPASHFAPFIDPRAWHANIPAVWPAPTEILLSEPTDRSDDGVPDAQDRPVEDDRPFYEEAISGWEVCPVTRHRNLLRVSLNFTGPDGFKFDYRQESCLTAQFIGSAALVGGIDVDNGFGSCLDLAGSPGWCRLEACKRLRFDIPADPVLNQLYNDLNAVALPLMIESFVLFGALR